MMAEGSAPPIRSVCVNRAVVVVLPCVPETATERGYRFVTSPSMTDRSMAGMPFSRAATSSGLSLGTAALYTTSSAPSTFSGLCSVNTGIPYPRTRSSVSDSLRSEPVSS